MYRLDSYSYRIVRIKSLWCLGVLVMFLVLTAAIATAQQFLNLDFEDTTPTGQVKGWYHGGEGYEAGADTEVVYQGKKSLRIKSISEGKFGVGTSSFPAQDAAGKRLRYSGYIKTEEVVNGYAGLWWRVDGKDGTLGFDNMGDRGVTGTTDWTKYEINLDIDSTVVNINFGVLMPGQGTAWFDALSIELDGEVYGQVRPEPFVADDLQLAWLRNQSIEFDTAEPGTDYEDLMPLKTMIGAARIVALGEATHGTKEFFQMKHRITEFLAHEMGFTIFGIEANMTEAARVNDYVLEGKGDPKEAIAGMYFWTWNTQEVLDMVEWMREYNASGTGRIEFWGFDMQYPTVAMDSVRSFVGRAEPAYLDSLKLNYDKVRESYAGLKDLKGRGSSVFFEPWHQAATRVLDHLQGNREIYIESFSEMEIDWAMQNARIVVQAAESRMTGKASRDESMADNVDWILEKSPPDSRIVLWAHNGHVARSLGAYMPMGSFLTDRHGDDIVVFGFAFHEGEYTARGANGLGTYTTSASEAGSIEWALHSTGLPRLILDMRGVSKSSSESGWLFEKVDFRSIGAMAIDHAFRPVVIADKFDLLIYFDSTSPSVQLNTARPDPGGR